MQSNNNNQGGLLGGFGGHNNTTGVTGNTGGGGDMLDKAVDFLEKKGGHQQSHSTTEKISDGIRKGFQKVTGKDVPIKDKTYQ
ncbi:hypothetical protein M422DRAFT_33356 [Sphaerobolus stellatus SS14]|uniref:Uncharacterized protein n=1 Tax=Sphaerobolus stellatus (strain SS14) TaxID=990650 RepID=A0A0C9VLJ3_SPHS4|nr:hypothetical protein M422DRAFT_33356 [Sphaerobolus stellatus SS14]